MKSIVVIIASSVVLFSGCLPGTTVTKNPGSHDNGIRYYRPKPYLLITPHENKEMNVGDEFVTLDLQMLPDFSEEYSIHIRPGLGTNQTNVVLSDGWNLTGLNVNIDSNFDENIEAVANSVAKFVPTQSGGDGGSAVGPTRTVVRATNVPIGYYEAVISKGADCKKRMYGWRYIGFSPYAPCPQESCGVDRQPCESSDLYGLVFEDGAMTFKPLNDARIANHNRIGPTQTRFQRAIQKLSGELSNIAPQVLRSYGINGVSNKSIDVSADPVTGVISISAALDQDQKDVYQGASASNFDIAESIASTFEQKFGEKPVIQFSVTDAS